MSSEENSDIENSEETQNYNELLLVLSKIKIYVEMVAKRLSEECAEDIPTLLEGTKLRDYQRKGYKWILTLYENGMNGILADEMGLGKTVQVIAALAALIEAGVTGPFLIVAPLSLLSVWADQLATFAPRIPSLIYYGALNERLKLRRRVRKRVRICMLDSVPTVNRGVINGNTQSDNATLDPTSASDCNAQIACEQYSATDPSSSFYSLASYKSIETCGISDRIEEQTIADPTEISKASTSEIDSPNFVSSILSCPKNPSNSSDDLQPLSDPPHGSSNNLTSRSFQSTDEHNKTAQVVTDNCERSEALTHLNEVIDDVLSDPDRWYDSKLCNLSKSNDCTNDSTSDPGLAATVIEEDSTSFEEDESMNTELATSVPHQTVNARVKGRFKELRTYGFWTCPVVLTSYEVAARDAVYLRKIPFKCLIVDEGQRLKNPTSKLYRRLAKFNTGLRLLLSGTPLQNRISELWSLLHFVLPEVFTSLEMFENWFDPAVLSDRAGLDRLVAAEMERALVTKLHCIISPFMLRRTKAESNLILPPKREILLRVGMTELQKELYEQGLTLCLNTKSNDQSTRGSNRALRYQGSITWLDPANIIPDKKSHTTNKTTPSRPLTRLHSQHSTQIRESGDEAESHNLRPVTRSFTKLVPETEQKASEKIDDNVEITPSTQKWKHLISSQINITNGLMLLRQIANHPFLVLDPPSSDCDMGLESELDIIDASEKTKLLDRLLTMLITSDHKVDYQCSINPDVLVLSLWREAPPPREDIE
ncbi:unnamed protein product [Echinostoma caproni]|uniref:Helicase ATP-binding domain-containing protein n=1 Tax=Echinostoma caproni TaxID=27848 RepID=A0A183ARZ0_9TREM|nr:unnamed protein product [Echinostoma caproni]